MLVAAVEPPKIPEVWRSVPALTIHAGGPPLVPPSVTIVHPLRGLEKSLDMSTGRAAPTVTVIDGACVASMLSVTRAVIVCVPADSVLVANCPVEPSAPLMLEAQVIELVKS